LNAGANGLNIGSPPPDDPDFEPPWAIIDHMPAATEPSATRAAGRGPMPAGPIRARGENT